MRRARLRMHIRKQTLYFLFAVSLFTTFDMYSGDILKGVLEKRFNNFLPENLKMSIGKIEGGIFRDIVSRDVAISHPDLKEPIKLDSLEMPYRIWYPLAKKFKLNFYPRQEQELRIFFGGDNPFINGHFSFQKIFGDFQMQGVFSLFDSKQNFISGEISPINEYLYAVGMNLNRDIDIQGLIDFKNRTISLDIKKDRVIVLLFADENRIILNAGLKHVDFKGIDLVGEMMLEIEHKGDIDRFRCLAKNLIINYSPFKDIGIEGQIIENRSLLDISLISVGDKYKKDIISGSAKIGILDKKYMHLLLKINDLLLEEFILTKYKEEIAKGAMDGEIHMKGPLERPNTIAHFDVQNGRIQDLEFESLIATLKGEGALLNIEDGRIIKDEGSLILSGEIDFGKWSEGKTFDMLRIETDQKVAVWNGWEVSKRFETSKIKAQKKVAKDITFSFETYANEDILRANQNDKESQIDVEYKIHKDESINLKFRNDESFVGLQRKVKF